MSPSEQPKPLTRCPLCRSKYLRVAHISEKLFTLDGILDPVGGTLTLQLRCMSCDSKLSPYVGRWADAVQAAIDAHADAFNARSEGPS